MAFDNSRISLGNESNGDGFRIGQTLKRWGGDCGTEYQDGKAGPKFQSWGVKTFSPPGVVLYKIQV